MDVLGCPFCLSQRGKGNTANFQRFSELDVLEEPRIVMSNCFAVADIAPLGRGHLLLITNDHKPRFEEFWFNEASEGRRFYEKYRLWWADQYGQDMIAFEHAMSIHSNEAGSACIDHAHVHILPVDFKVEELVLNVGLQVGADYYENGNQALGLMVGGSTCFSKGSDNIDSQVFRYAITRLRGGQFWHWRDHIDFSCELGTADRLRETYMVLQAFREATKRTISSEGNAPDDNQSS